VTAAVPDDVTGPMIPYGRQDISAADLAAVAAVLQSDFITQGPMIPAFEAALIAQTGAAYALAMHSATAALHVACMALDLGPGDMLWTAPNTFVATSNAALYCGAGVDFVDIDPVTYNICLDTLEAKLETASRHGTLPKIVIPVHFAGQSCDMIRLAALRDTYGFRIIEDASHAIGGSYHNAPVGNCAHSDICIFSFHPVKIITTAEGGAALTNDPVLAERMGRLRTHGITRDPAAMSKPSEGPWYYEQTGLGYNYRMTDIQAALGCSQMTRLHSFIDARHARRTVYDRDLADLPLTLPHQPGYQHSGLHLYPVLLTDAARLDRATAFAKLRALGIGVNVLYIPVYLQPYYARLGFKPGLCPHAEDYYARMLAIPMFATLTAADQARVIAALRRVLA
jgi:UDP-4-amino-4,6-dideoxy-N-acetyl-beta-L-altrosamine transaminase